MKETIKYFSKEAYTMGKQLIGMLLAKPILLVSAIWFCIRWGTFILLVASLYNFSKSDLSFDGAAVDINYKTGQVQIGKVDTKKTIVHNPAPKNLVDFGIIYTGDVHLGYKRQFIEVFGLHMYGGGFLQTNKNGWPFLGVQLSVGF